MEDYFNSINESWPKIPMSFRSPILSFCLLAIAASLPAQQAATPIGSSPRKLANLIPGFLQDTLQGLDPTIRSIILTSISPNVNLSSVNSAVATELSNLPVPSPASAQRYTFDPNLGVYVPSAQSLGPILTERAETIGKDKFFFAVTYQRFQFDRLDQLDLRNFSFRIPVAIPAGVVGSSAIRGTIDANNSLSLMVSETTAHFTYGITHWLDASYALPIVTSTVEFSTQAAFGVVPKQAIFTVPQISVRGSATGLGDGIARIKAKLLEQGGLTLAVAGDVRIPTGDEFNYHGAGAYGIKPFLIASLTKKFLSPHVNAGYQWNGKSFLGSSTGTEKVRLPGQLFYSAGAEASLSPRVTVAFDVLDQIIIHGRRTFVNTETISGTTYTTASFPNQSRHELNAATGFKARLGRDVVLTGNLLFRLNDSGLRSRVVPLVGLSYLF